jgi:hypothetical protein
LASFCFFNPAKKAGIAGRRSQEHSACDRGGKRMIHWDLHQWAEFIAGYFVFGLPLWALFYGEEWARKTERELAKKRRNKS